MNPLHPPSKNYDGGAGPVAAGLVPASPTSIRAEIIEAWAGRRGGDTRASPEVRMGVWNPQEGGEGNGIGLGWAEITVGRWSRLVQI